MATLFLPSSFASRRYRAMFTIRGSKMCAKLRSRTRRTLAASGLGRRKPTDEIYSLRLLCSWTRRLLLWPLCVFCISAYVRRIAQLCCARIRCIRCQLHRAYVHDFEFIVRKIQLAKDIIYGIVVNVLNCILFIVCYWLNVFQCTNMS